MQLKLIFLISFVSYVFSDSTIDVLPTKWECAIRSTKSIPGNDIFFEDFLYTVLLEYKKNGSSNGLHCGGAVINNNYILTAAHCVTGDVISKHGNPYKVRFYEYNRSLHKNPEEVSEYPPFEDSDIQEIIPHPEYNISNLNRYNDIALIRFIKKPSDYFDVVCFEYHQIFDNDRITVPRNRFSVVGWSITENDDGRTNKRQGFMETISNEECAKYVNITLIDSQFCAIKRIPSYNDKKDDESCYGDSGGAIIRNGYNIDYYISGIDSIRFTKCNNEIAPIIYTNVTQFLPWIRNNIKS